MKLEFEHIKSSAFCSNLKLHHNISERPNKHKRINLVPFARKGGDFSYFNNIQLEYKIIHIRAPWRWKESCWMNVEKATIHLSNSHPNWHVKERKREKAHRVHNLWVFLFLTHVSVREFLVRKWRPRLWAKKRCS